MKEITLRDATPDDADFVDALTKSVMASYVEKTWKSLKAHTAYFQKNCFNLQTTKIIQFKGKNAGRLSVIWSERFVQIDNIHLLPEYQGIGIGKVLIEGILRQACSKGLYVKLMVLKINPAKALYERLGFKVYKKDAERLYMRT